MSGSARRMLLVGFGLALLARPVAGQRLVDDWLVRTGAGPGALQVGATAAFWNPAGVAEQRGRGSLVLLELLAPEATGVDVLALSGGWRLDDRTTLAAGYQHLGIDGIDYTETSPEEGIPLDVGQDLFAAGAARRLSERLVVGAAAQYLHSTEALAEDGQLAIGAGARVLAPLPVPVTLAGFAYSLRNRVSWALGAELAPELPGASWRGTVQVGVANGQAMRGTSVRVGANVSWRDLVELGGSLVGEPDANERQWEPVVAGVVRLSRYELGVVREWLPNAFGAVHTFRFGIAF